MISSRSPSQACHWAKLSDERDGLIPPPSYARPLSPMSTQSQQLLYEARRLATCESQRTGRRVTMMDIILASTPPMATTAQPYRCVADSSHLHRPVQKECGIRDRLGEMELYWAKRVNPSMRTAFNVARPMISAERSTIPWPPNLDGKTVSWYRMIW